LCATLAAGLGLITLDASFLACLASMESQPDIYKLDLLLSRCGIVSVHRSDQEPDTTVRKIDTTSRSTPFRNGYIPEIAKASQLGENKITNINCASGRKELTLS
jgi:hypothetical protein